MAINVTTTTQVPSVVQAYYDRKLLERAKPLVVFTEFAQKSVIPQNNSGTIKFRRYGNLAPKTTPLTEGTVPTGSQLSVTDITATLAQYGDFVAISDVVQLTVENKVLNDAVDLLAQQMAESLDLITANVLLSGTNVIYAGGVGSRSAVESVITGSDLDLAINILERNDAKKFTEMINASTGFNTTPIAPCYWAITHPNVRFILDDITGFVPVEKYPSQTNVHPGEIGAYKNIRFIQTSLCPYWAGAGANTPSTGRWFSTTVNNASKLDVYPIIVVAQNSYGVVELERGSVKTIIKTPGASDTSNPLNQFSTVGWKAFFAAKILNDAWIVRIETASKIS